MQVVILAGGMGTRLQEETSVRPKPMVEVGGKPILWHIMKHYAQHDITEFRIALGYMGDFIKNYFLNQYKSSGDLTIDFATRAVRHENPSIESWKVHLHDTGTHAQTGGRLKRLQRFLGNETFMLTYGDGVSNVDLTELLRFHRAQGRLATVTAVRPPARFGGLVIQNGMVEKFTEKPIAGEGWINGGFLVLEPGVFQYLEDDEDSLEVVALETLATEGQLAAFTHDHFWQCMDTLHDKNYLEQLWDCDQAPWKIWEDDEVESPIRLPIWLGQRAA